MPETSQHRLSSDSPAPLNPIQSASESTYSTSLSAQNTQRQATRLFRTVKISTPKYILCLYQGWRALQACRSTASKADTVFHLTQRPYQSSVILRHDVL